MAVVIENGFIVKDQDVFEISTTLRENLKNVLHRKLVQLYVDTAYEAYDLLTANNGEYENIYVREHGELTPLQSAWSYTKLWVEEFPEDVDAELLFFKIPDSKDLLFIVTGPEEAIKLVSQHEGVFPYPCSEYDNGVKGKERMKTWERTVDFNQSLVSQGLTVRVLGKQEKSITMLISKESLQRIGFRRPTVKKRLETLAEHVLPNDATLERKRVFMERNQHLIDDKVKFGDIVKHSR